MDTVQVHTGDCMNILPSLPSGSVDCIITDPPYGLTEIDWDKPIDFSAWMQEALRVVRDDGAVVVFSQNPTHPHLFPAFS